MNRLIVVAALAACGPRPVAGPRPEVGCPELATVLREDGWRGCLERSIRDAPELVAAELSRVPWTPALQARLGNARSAPEDWLAVAQQLTPHMVAVLPDFLMFSATATLNNLAQRERDATLALRVFALADRPTAHPQLRRAIALQRLAIAEGMRDAAATAAAWQELGTLADTSPALRSELIQRATADRNPQRVAALCTGHVDAATVWPCLAGDPANVREYVAKALSYATIGQADARALAAADPGAIAFPGLSCLSEPRVADPRSVIRSPRPASTADEVRLYNRLREVFTGGTANCFLSQAAAACYGLIEKGESCPLSFVVADYFKSLDRVAQERFFSIVMHTKAGIYDELATGNAHERVVLLHLHLVLAEIVLHKGRTASELDMTAYHLACAQKFLTDLREPAGALRDLVPPRFREEVCHAPHLGCDQTCHDAYMYRCDPTCRRFAAQVEWWLCAP